MRELIYELSQWLYFLIGLSIVLAFPIGLYSHVREHIKNNKKHE